METPFDQYPAHWSQETADKALEYAKPLIPPGPPPKLRLVLDLDHTLLCSSFAAEVAKNVKPDDANPDEGAMARAMRGLKSFKLVHPEEELGMIIKLRPGLKAFLERCAQNFELCVYTHAADERYVKAAIKAIDPGGDLVGTRFAHASSAAEDRVKSLTDVYASFWGNGEDNDAAAGEDVVDASRILVLDDSSNAWPRHKRNLIKCERYIFFPESAKNFGHDPRRSLMLHARDEVADRGLLSSLGRVFEDVSAQFKAMWAAAQAPGSAGRVPKPDIRDAVDHVRKQVLGGVVLLFSAVLSKQEQQSKAYEKNRHYALAKALGAKVVFDKRDDVTHVCCPNKSTDKAGWARTTGRFLVQPHWVDASHALWHRADERGFAVL